MTKRQTTARLQATVLVASVLAGCSAPGDGPAISEQSRLETFRRQFLHFCDLATAELHKDITPFGDRENADPATHHMPFFEDAHAVRAMGAAYDMTGNRAYLDACRRWSDRIVAYQNIMHPRGAYYINHKRAPGQNEGPWNVADSGTIGMGVLATAVRCPDRADRAYYLASVEAFANLVIDNYVTPEGGITNGLWPIWTGPWWCSSATVGSMLFRLYDETGNERYLKAAMGAMTWLLRQDFRELKPITFEQRPSGTVYYCFELYASGLKHLAPDSPDYKSLLHQLDAAFDWMAKNQKTRGAPVPPYLEKNVDMAGLPSLMYSFARQLPQYRNQIAPADGELQYVGDLLLAKGEPNVSRLMVWEVMTWGMLSYAERLAPGAMERSSQRPTGT